MGTTRQVFVGHAFTQEYLDDFRDAVNRALAAVDLTACYADETIVDGHILADKIEPLIRQSAFALFDVSYKNRPNVWTEYGWTRAVGIPILLTVRKGRSLPSDIQGFDRIEYVSFKDLEAALRDKLRRAKFANEGERKLRDLSEVVSGWTFVAGGSPLTSTIDVLYGRANILSRCTEIARAAGQGDLVFGQCKTCAGYTSSLQREFYSALERGVRCEFLIESNAESSEFVSALRQQPGVAIRVVDETIIRYFGVRQREILIMLPTSLDEIGMHLSDGRLAEYHYRLFRQMWADGGDLH